MLPLAPIVSRETRGPVAHVPDIAPVGRRGVPVGAASARSGAMGVSAHTIHGKLAPDFERVLTRVIDRQRGVVDFHEFAALTPDAASSASTWSRYEDALNALADALRDESITRIVDRDGVTHARNAGMSTMERDLRRAWVDPTKAHVIADAAAVCFSDLDATTAATLGAALKRYIHFIGPNTENARRILTAQPVVANDARTAAAVERFLAQISARLREVRSSVSNVSEDTVAILTRNGGGAHTSIAATLDSALSASVPIKQVNLSQGYRDPLQQTLGYSYADAYNVLFQQHGHKRCADLAQDVNALVLEFVSSQHFEYLLEQTGNACVIVSTTHWREDLALVAERDRRVLLQICDYGELNDKLREAAQAVVQYDLQGIEFLLPSAEAVHALADGTERIPASLTLLDYPVDEAWTVAPSNTKRAEVRDAYGIRQSSHLATVMAGLQGVGPVLADTLTSIVRELAKRIANGAAPADTDVLLVCGKNKGMREAVPSLVAASVAVAAAELGLVADDVRRLERTLTIVTTGFVPNADLAVLVQDSGAVVTKPGGRTTAELMAAGVAAPILAYDGTHPWEQPNLEHAQQRLGATVVNDMRSIGQAVLHRMSSTHDPVPTASHGSVIRRILEVHRQYLGAEYER